MELVEMPSRCLDHPAGKGRCSFQLGNDTALDLSEGIEKHRISFIYPYIHIYVYVCNFIYPYIHAQQAAATYWGL